MSKTPEGAVLKACMEYLALKGICHFRNNTGGTPLHDGSGRYRPAPKSSRGSPDIIAVVSGWAIAIEAKSKIGRQSPDQSEFQARWEKAGGLYLLVRSAAELRDKLSEDGCI